MRITQWGEYGVLCALFLGERTKAGQASVNAAEISQAQHIDLQYTQQVLQRLRKGGIIESIRGPQGGYHLTRPADQITLGEILVAAEGDTFEVICETKPLDAERCNPAVPCNLRPIWFRLKDHINSFLSGYTLAMLIDQPAPQGDQPIQISRTSRA